MTEYIHIRNLEKYHPGYKDRTLQWAKIYINIADGDPDAELIQNEIDWARFVKIILLELRAKKPLPNSDAYWARKGFDIKERPMSLTIQMLHNFLDIVTENGEVRYESVTQSRVDKIKRREEKDATTVATRDEDFLKSLKANPAYSGIDIDRELGKMDAWILVHPGRKKTKKFIVNWLNKYDHPLEAGNHVQPEKKGYAGRDGRDFIRPVKCRDENQPQEISGGVKPG